MRNFMSIMLVAVMVLASVKADAAISVIKANHFEAGSNLTVGNKKGNAKDLAALIQELQDAVNTNTAAAAANSAADAKLVKYTAAATAGGAATQVVVVTGLGASDIIYSVSQRVKGANSLPLLGYQAQASNSLTLVFSADPGAGAIVEILVKKP